MNKKLIIWDFDGVLFDSLRECIVVTKLSNDFLESQNLSLNKISTLCSKKSIDDLIKKMGPLRPFIVKGQDYLWQYRNIDLLKNCYQSQIKYNKIFHEIFDADNDNLFEKGFYHTRNQLQKFLGNEYFGLFIPYNGSLNALKTSLKKNINYICSARDFNAIKSILTFYGINFNPKRIFTRDHNGFGKKYFSKLDQIGQILNEENCLDKEFTLIEDQAKIPESIQNKYPKMKLIYAKYGYGLESEWSNLKRENLYILEKSENLLETILN